MRFNKVILIFLRVFPLILIIGCAATFTVEVVDEETNKRLSDIPLRILDTPDRVEIDSKRTADDGTYSFSLSTITSDSFFLSVPEDDYFAYEIKLAKPTGKHVERVRLSKKVTTISGYVLDDSTYEAISACIISTVPQISQTAETDTAGMFILKSDEFSNVEHTIFATAPDYIENSTTIIPKLNQKNELELAIFLKRIGKEEIKIEGEGIHIIIDPTRSKN